MLLFKKSIGDTITKWLKQTRTKGVSNNGKKYVEYYEILCIMYDVYYSIIQKPTHPPTNVRKYYMDVLKLLEIKVKSML